MFVVGGSHMRVDATVGQLVRAARGLEAIAATCAGARRDDLLALAADLHTRAVERRAAERRRARVLHHAGLR